MIKLIDIINEVSFGADLGKEQQAQQILNQIKTNLQNKKFTVLAAPDYGGMGMKIGKLTVIIFSGNYGRLEATTKYGYVPDAVFEPRELILKSYKNNVYYDKTTKKMVVELHDENQIKHELAHYLDAQTMGKNVMAQRSRGHGQELARLDTANTRKDQLFYYYNTPEEFNAHWFQFIMPEVNSYLDKTNQLPDFNTFRNNIYALPQTKEFIGYLNPDNKKRFDKRLGVYYQGIQDSLAGRPLHSATQQRQAPVYKSPGFIQRIKNLFGGKKAA